MASENHKNLAKNRGLVKMVGMRSDLMREFIGFTREFFAVIHYFSDFMVAILVYNLIFEGGAIGVVLVWLVVGLISAVIAELLKSKLPTLLRLIWRRN